MKRILITGALAIGLALLIAALAPSAHARGQSYPTISGTWDVSIQMGSVLVRQKWVLASDGRALLTPTYPYLPTFSAGTWRRNSDYFQFVDDLNGDVLNYHCTLSGDTFSMYPVDAAGRRTSYDRYIGERR